MKLLVVATVAVVAISATPTAALSLRPASEAAPLGNERLSNETTLTRVVSPYKLAPVRAKPSKGAKKVAKLHYLTEDGPLETYMALQSKRVNGKAWIQLRIPGRPNGRTGWVPEDVMGP